MAYTTIDNPELYFQTKLYTGNGSTNAITLDGSENMQPDWVWIKDRTVGFDHVLQDSVRGTTKIINSNQNYAEFTNANSITSFNSDGFTTGSYVATNQNTTPFVAWNWKAGTSFTNDASSTGVGSIDSAGSVNTDAGFSITSYTGTGSAATVAHGLGVVPSVYILKNRTSTSNWFFYHKSTGATKSLFLDGTDAPITSSGYFNNTEPTSSVFSIGSESDLSGSSQNMIAYCFAEKKGYSKFGSYTGNGGNQFIYTGFKPSFVIEKRSSNTSEWDMYDNKRNTFNSVTKVLKPNASDAEATYGGLNFLSNGFEAKGSLNDSGQTLIYMAFAESSFVTSTGIPTTAR